MRDSIDRQRRLILATALSGVAAVELPRTGNAFAQGGRSVPAVRAPSSKRLGPLRHIDAGVLKTAYYEDEPATRPAAILLPAFPYHLTSYVQFPPLLSPPHSRAPAPSPPRLA